MTELSNEEIQHYGRHVMPDVSLAGQLQLKQGTGIVCRRGRPQFASGALSGRRLSGTLGLVECDVVDLSNIQRQILYGSADVTAAETRCRLRATATTQPAYRSSAACTDLDTGNVIPIIEAVRHRGRW
ncbi:MAG: hypothetical protein IPG64_21010 [Haliea sp.]|nr:hypothetical protein [Haliea sp.]